MLWEPKTEARTGHPVVVSTAPARALTHHRGTLRCAQQMQESSRGFVAQPPLGSAQHPHHRKAHEGWASLVSQQAV